LILKAVDSIKEDVSGNPLQRPRPQDIAPAPGMQRQIAHVPFSLPSGRRETFQLHLGYYPPAEMSGIGLSPNTIYLPNSSVASSDRRKPLRPWLFGGWWKFRDSANGDQLIGLGVRLSRSPFLEHAEGNALGVRVNSIALRGTHLRLRVAEGELKDIRK